MSLTSSPASSTNALVITSISVDSADIINNNGAILDNNSSIYEECGGDGRRTPTSSITDSTVPSAPAKASSTTRLRRGEDASRADSDEVELTTTVDPLYNELTNYPLKEEFTQLGQAFLKSYWFVQSTNGNSTTPDHFYVDAHTATKELLPAINHFLRKHTAVDADKRAHLNDFEKHGNWIQALQTLQENIRKHNKDADSSLLLEIEGSELRALVDFFHNCEEIVETEKKRKATEAQKEEKAQSEKAKGNWSRWIPSLLTSSVTVAAKPLGVVAGWGIKKGDRVHQYMATHGVRIVETVEITSSPKKSEAEWVQLTQCLLDLVRLYESESPDQEEVRKCALIYFNKAIQFGMFRENPEKRGSYTFDMNVLRSWIDAQHALHAKLGVTQHSVDQNEWKEIFQKAGQLAKGILQEANKITGRELFKDLAQEAAELQKNIKQKHYAYLQAINHPDLKRDATAKSNKEESPFSFLFRKTLDLRDKILDNSISTEDKTTLSEAVASAEQECKNMNLSMHPDMATQFRYLCARLREIAESTNVDEHGAEQKNKIGPFLSAFEAFMTGHFCLYRKGQKDLEAIKDDFSKWTVLWQEKLKDADSETQFIKLNEFGEWHDLKQINAWPSDLSRAIYRVETFAEYPAETQLYKKIKIFLILQIIDYLFNTHLCKDVKGGYSEAYRDLIVDWQPDRESTFYDNLFAKLKDDPKQLNGFQMVLAKLIYKLIAPVLERVVSGVVENAHTHISTIASYFPDSEEREKSKQDDTRFFRATVISKRNEIFKRVSSSLENVLNVDDEYHSAVNASQRSGLPLDQIKEKLKEPRFHKQKAQDRIYYDADRKIVQQLSYTPEWSKQVGEFYDDKMKRTGAKALKIFYSLVRFIAMNALYIPEKLTGYILRETVFYFYHRSPVSTKGMVATMQSGISFGETSSHLLNTLFWNLLDKLDTTLTNSLKHIDQVIDGNKKRAGQDQEEGKDSIQITTNGKPLYSKENLTNKSTSLTAAEKRNCHNAIDKLLRVIRRYRENFDNPTRIVVQKGAQKSKEKGDKGILGNTLAVASKLMGASDPAPTNDDKMEDDLKDVALGLGSKLTEALDSILTSDFLKAQFAEFQKKLNESLDGVPVTDTRTAGELKDRIELIAEKAITLGVKSTCDESEGLNRAHIQSYGTAMLEIQRDTIDASIIGFHQKNIEQLDESSSEPGVCLVMIKDRLDGFAAIRQGTIDYENKMKVLIANAKGTQIRGVDQKGPYRLDVQLEKRRAQVMEIVTKMKADIQSGLNLEGVYANLDKQFKGFKAVEDATIDDLISDKILIQSMRDKERRQLYFNRLISSMISLYLPKDGERMTSQKFWGLCSALQRAGIFPTSLPFGVKNAKIKVPLFDDPAFKRYGLSSLHQDDSGRKELEKTLNVVSQRLFDSLQAVYNEMTVSALPTRMLGGIPRYFSLQSWNLFNTKMKEECQRLDRRSEELQDAFRKGIMEHIKTLSAQLRNKEGKVLTPEAYNQQIENLGPFNIDRSFTVLQKGEAMWNANKTSLPMADSIVARYETAVKDKIEAFRDFVVDQDSISEYLAQTLVLDPFIQK